MRLVSQWLAFTLLLLAACAADTPYAEVHELDRLTVVYTDHAQIQRRYLAQQDLRGAPLLPFESQARALYDTATNTIYCERGDFLACGHELYHATHGNFHP